ncbi:MAG: hypothetical protein ACRCTY_02565, partial [Candidatus Adiutrix sp.]
ESIMACGIGACLGCVVKAKPAQGKDLNAQHAKSDQQVRPAQDQNIDDHDLENYVQVCTCGPVFWADSVSL